MAQALGEGRPILPAGEASAAKGVPDREGDEVESDDSDHASVDLDAELEPPAEPAEREVFRGVPWSDCAGAFGVGHNTCQARFFISTVWMFPQRKLQTF